MPFVGESVFQVLTNWLSIAVLIHKQDTSTSRQKQYKRVSHQHNFNTDLRGKWKADQFFQLHEIKPSC